MLLSLLCMVSHLSSAQSEKSLKGKWRVDTEMTFNNIDPEAKARFDKMSDKIKAMTRESYEDRTFHFMDGNKVIIDFSVGNQKNHTSGNYEYDKKFQILKITADGMAITYNVEFSLKDNIRLVVQNGASSSLIKSIYLTRIN
jgi:hypothetical protein